jgi:heme-degrading monooxygenase HmoA
MHVVIRRYNDNAKLMDVLEQKHADVERLIRGVPGFVAYYLVRSTDGGASISVYQDQAGTRESTRLAGDWVRQNAPEAVGTPPEVTEGETIIQFGV